MNAHTFRALEFDRIRDLLLQRAGSAAGRVRLEGLEPLTEPGAVREALARTTEGRQLLEEVGRQPYHDLPDPATSLAGSSHVWPPCRCMRTPTMPFLAAHRPMLS